MRFTELDTYSSNLSKPESKRLSYIAQETKLETALPQMLSGHVQGKTLSLLASLMNAKNILEVGTFTGYATLAMAEGAPSDAAIDTLDIDETTAGIARKHFSKSPFGHKINQIIAPAIETIEKLDKKYDFAFIDADKRNYPNYFKAILPKMNIGGLMVFDNVLWSGEVLEHKSKQARAIHETNELIKNDPRVDNFILNVRDGLNLARVVSM